MSEYREIAGFPGYFIGTDGLVYSTRDRKGNVTDSWKALTLYRRRYGARYMVVCMRGKPCGQVCQKYVHRLVLEAFVGPCPHGMVACHWDNDTTNNSLANLRWDTQKANMSDKKRHGTYGKLGEDVVREIFQLREQGLKQREIAEHFGIDRNTVLRVLRGRKWSHLGIAPSTVKPVMNRGESTHSAKLTENGVREIFSLYASGLTKTALAKRFGVSRQVIGMVLVRKTWRHVVL